MCYTTLHRSKSPSLSTLSLLSLVLAGSSRRHGRPPLLLLAAAPGLRRVRRQRALRAAGEGGLLALALPGPSR